MKKKIKRALVLSSTILLLTGCSQTKNINTNNNSTNENNSTTISEELSMSNLFTTRDLEQTIDLSESTTYELENNKNITITKEGIYVINGSSENASIIVEAEETEKVQIVLNGVTMTNTTTPCIYVKSADKVFITLVGENTLKTTGTFTADGETNTDAVIFSKEDIVLNGKGSITIESTSNGITSKDDLKITGGTITINSTEDAIEANDSIAIADGDITITTQKDGLHAEYDEDDTKGYIYIGGGTLNINASDDGIQATTITQIDGGTITISAQEGIEGTSVQINDGTITIKATDDGINASQKSQSYTPNIEINGGTITISMSQGDTDAIDSNGNIYINGGTITISAQSPFDYDGEGKYSGGTLIVNGEETTSLNNQMMGGPGEQKRGPQGRR